nr:hypothetical protein [Tanacetum cinerariifolium]
STARIEITEEGTKILATVDGQLRTVFESSIRRNLKLNDKAGISSLPDAEFLENLTLMRYNISPNQKFTFQKGKFSHQWKYLIHTIMQQSEMVFKFAAQELEIINLKARVRLLEDIEGGGIAQSGDDAPIKRRKQLKDGGVQVVSTAAEVATVTVSIPTGSGVVSTASPTIPTTASIFTTATESTLYTRRKGKETMVEYETPKKKKVQEQIDVQLARELEEEMARDAQRMNEQIAQDAEITRLHVEKELQMLIDGLDRNNETVAK